MDTETVFRILEDLNKKIEENIYISSDLELFMISDDYSAEDIKKERNVFRHRNEGLKTFRDYLYDKYIEPQVSQVENEMNRGE